MAAYRYFNRSTATAIISSLKLIIEAAEVIAKLGDPALPELLDQAIEQLVPFDNCMILSFPRGARPQLLYSSSMEQSHTPHEANPYLNGAYLLDPFYRAAIEGIASGYYPLEELAPQGFEQSEYYRSYYRHIDMSDEVGYLIHVSNECFINISLIKVGGSPRFSKKQRECLAAIASVLKEIFIRHWQGLTSQPEQLDSAFHRQLETALECFGKSLLTDRECEVIHLILHGHASKSIASRLGISLPTVKMHRKNCYAKLDISSQAELFSLFINSLPYLGQNPGED